MATIEEALVVLLAAPAVVAIAGSRAFPDFLPQDVAYPAIRYFRVSTPRLRTLRGPVGRAKPRFQIDCYALDPKAAKALADAVRDVLDGHAGVTAGVPINDASVIDEAMSADDELVKRVFGRRLDVTFNHSE